MQNEENNSGISPAFENIPDSAYADESGRDYLDDYVDDTHGVKPDLNSEPANFAQIPINSEVANQEALTPEELHNATILQGLSLANTSTSAPVALNEIPVVAPEGAATSVFTEYFSAKVNELGVDLNKPFAKNTQSDWFKEFNEQYANHESNVGHKLFCQPNGYFYKENDPIEKSLVELGLSKEDAKTLAPEFQYSFIGNTQSNKKKSKGSKNGFKAFVLHLKDPNGPNAANIANKLSEAKERLVHEKLAESPNLDQAKALILSKADELINNDRNKTGVEPFIGVNGNLFLNSTALYDRLRKIPEIRGKYTLEEIDRSQEASFFGYSEGLNSYYSDKLNICKVITSDPENMPQERLEEVITSHLQDLNDHLAQVPKEALVLNNVPLFNENQNELDNSPNSNTNTPKQTDGQKQAKPNADKIENGTPANNFVNNKNTQKYKKDMNNEELDRNFDQNPNQKKNKEKEPNSLAQAMVEAASKITGAALTAILQVALMILKAIIALLRAIVSVASKSAAKVFPNMKTVSMPSVNSFLPKSKWNENAIQGIEKGKEHSINNDSKDIKAGLDEALDVEETLGKDKKSEVTIDDELRKLGVDNINKKDLVSDTLNKLDEDKKKELSDKAFENLKGLSNIEKAEYLKELTLPTKHQLSPDLNAILGEETRIDDKFGILLATNDKVIDSNGEYLGVVSAYDVGGELIYALAKENDDGNYSIKFDKAEDLTLLAHNAYNFDNLENLIKQANDELLNNDEFDSEKITEIPLLNQKDDIKGLSIREVFEKLNPVSLEDSLEIKVSELLNNDEAFKAQTDYSVPQLHIDATKYTFNNIGRGNLHPVYGRLLDVNDQIEGVLPNSNLKIKASVLGAYASKGDLFYSVVSNGDYYNFKASDTTLLRNNGGELKEEEIKELKKNGLPSGSVPTSISIKKDGINLLTPFDKYENLVSLQSTLNNQPVQIGSTNLGILPIKDSQEINHISLTGYGGQKTHFASIGETIEDGSSQKRVLAVEIKDTLLGLKAPSIKDTRLVYLNMDDPSLRIEKNGIDKQDIVNLIDKAKDIYNLGVVRKTANLMSHFAEKAKDLFISNESDHSALAESHFLKNEMLIKLLENEAQVNSPKEELGKNADLSLSEIDKEVVISVINNPESLTPSQAYMDKASTLTEFNGVNTATPIQSFEELSQLIQTDTQENSLVNNAVIENTASPAENVSYNSMEQDDVSITQDSVNTANQVQESPIANSELIERVSRMDSDSPLGRLLKLAAMYTSGERIANNRDNGIDLLTDKEELDGKKVQLMQDMKELGISISDKFDHLEFNGDVPDLVFSKIKDPQDLKDLITKSPEVSLVLENMLSEHGEYKELLEDHLQKFTHQVQKLGGQVDHSHLDLTELADLNGVESMVTSLVSENIKDVNKMDNFVTILDNIKNSDSELKYGEIMKESALQSSKSTEFGNQKLAEITTSFEGKNQVERSQSKDKSSALEM